MLLETAVSNPWWAEIILTAFGLIITYYVIPYLRKKTELAHQEVINAEISGKTYLNEQLREFIYDAAANVIEKEFISIARMVVDGKIKSAEEVKAELYKIGKIVESETIEHFKLQGIDVIKEFGEMYVKQMIRLAADKMSPFPGKPTAIALADTYIAEKLVSMGVEWVKTYFDTRNKEDAAATATRDVEKSHHKKSGKVGFGN